MKFLTPPPPFHQLLSAIQMRSEPSCWRMFFKWMAITHSSLSYVSKPGACLAKGWRLPVDQLASEFVHLVLHALHLRVEPIMSIFFALKDLICIILRILLWGKLALWSNLCVLIHKWEKSSLCGMGKKIGNGPPCENSSYTFSDRIILIFKKIAKIHDLRSGLLPRLKISVQKLESLWEKEGK